MPRRVHDTDMEEKYLKRFGKERRFWRKAVKGEEDISEPYPIWKAGLRTFAHFGIGIGIYFMQLLSLGGACFIGGMLLIAAILAYSASDYGMTSSLHPLVRLSAACESLVNVTVTTNCANNATECIAQLRPDCELPYNAAMADLCMSVFILAAVLLSKVFENSIIEELDEAVQTAQDYSVCVNDPDEDADDPDEWYEFFSQFGEVVYITVTRRNLALTSLVCKRHGYKKRLDELKEEEGAEKEIEKIHRKIEKVEKKMKDYYGKFFPPCRVYVTFNHENEQRICKEALEVPDIVAMLDLKKDIPKEYMFQGENVLDVVEPPEPDGPQ